ncbi:hypothetical protein TNCT_608711 [Trichonephila clavata]|uniref:Uncharacterized protein n=1 Tax=Trichonephila clavata TaxID=2740835 RepID=A0A8X6K8P9_TRICU|nr:hypothetical protein TNCT_608711 [Trichonephila clavata]
MDLFGEICNCGVNVLMIIDARVARDGGVEDELELFPVRERSAVVGVTEVEVRSEEQTDCEIVGRSFNRDASLLHDVGVNVYCVVADGLFDEDGSASPMA